jgi:DNA primase
MLSKIVTLCKELLDQSPLAYNCKEYLDSRLDKETQDKFQFGYFPAFKDIKLISSIVSEEELIDNNLIYKFGAYQKCFFENHNLIMPYKDAYGNIVALVGRTLYTDEERKERNIAKYKNSSFKKELYLFNLNEAIEHIKENGFVYVVEGQFDAIKAYESGLKNVVALGNSNMTGYQLALILRYTNNIHLLLDNDEAGIKGAEKIIKDYSQYANIVSLRLPKGYKDLDDCLKQVKADDLTFGLTIY